MPTEFMQTRQEGTSFRRQWQIYILTIKGKSEQDPFKRKRCVGSDGVALAAILVTALMTDLMLSGCAPSTSLMLKYSTLLGTEAMTLDQDMRCDAARQCNVSCKAFPNASYKRVDKHVWPPPTIAPHMPDHSQTFGFDQACL